MSLCRGGGRDGSVQAPANVNGKAERGARRTIGPVVTCRYPSPVGSSGSAGGLEDEDEDEDDWPGRIHF
ncbi:MAG: hypothetical protein GX174_10565 [Lentisphaerae bacterium]|nr:hypothetical protein [Lentisphaerota bacterium]